MKNLIAILLLLLLALPAQAQVEVMGSSDEVIDLDELEDLI